jgi:hypothetical protein
MPDRHTFLPDGKHTIDARAVAPSAEAAAPHFGFWGLLAVVVQFCFLFRPSRIDRLAAAASGLACPF